MKKIRALSFDFDGCLFNEKYRANFFPLVKKTKFHEARHLVILTNQDFLDAIKNQNTDFDHVLTYVGSARQSKYVDEINFIRNKTESSFKAIKTICKYLDVELDPFLMADIHGNLDSGESFKRAEGGEVGSIFSWQAYHPNPVCDETKFTLLYAQMHKIATEHPEDEITFDFYDDRKSILHGLNMHFNRFQAAPAIPKNITLRLNQYHGDRVTPFSVIKGTGCIDVSYRQTVKHINSNSRLYFKNTITHESLVTPEIEKMRREILWRSYSSFFPSRTVSSKQNTPTLSESVSSEYVVSNPLTPN